MKPRKAAFLWMESGKPDDTAGLLFVTRTRTSRVILKNTGDRLPRSYSSAPDRRERGACAGFEALQSFAQAKLPHECDHLEGIII